VIAFGSRVLFCASAGNESTTSAAIGTMRFFIASPVSAESTAETPDCSGRAMKRSRLTAFLNAAQGDERCPRFTPPRLACVPIGVVHGVPPLSVPCELRSPLAWRHSEAGTKCLIEVREIVETATVRNLGDAAGPLKRMLQCLAAGIEAGLQ